MCSNKFLIPAVILILILTFSTGIRGKDISLQLEPQLSLFQKEGYNLKIQLFEGEDLELEVVQKGKDNFVLQLISGDNNTSFSLQDGNNNFSLSLQKGEDNSAQIKQKGNNNKAVIRQKGNKE